MSKARVLKRVPMDFDWPVHAVWIGYISDPEYDPPTGNGFQMWETTSEGSPQSPVFDSLDSLCEWCAGNTTVFANTRLSSADWKIYLTNPDARISAGIIVIA